MSMDELQIGAATPITGPARIEIPKFEEMPKIGRLSRGCTVTEKIDGTNASIYISEEGYLEGLGLFLTGSRTRWITPEDDNYRFSRWAHEHKDELLKLGPGHHFGEWWGLGIQRNYGLKEKCFSLFNTSRWHDDAVRPACCSVVPVLYEGEFDMMKILQALEKLEVFGSAAAPGFMNAEGVVVYHHATKTSFKKTIKNDDKPKGQMEK